MLGQIEEAVHVRYRSTYCHVKLTQKSAAIIVTLPCLCAEEA